MNFSKWTFIVTSGLLFLGANPVNSVIELSRSKMLNHERAEASKILIKELKKEKNPTRQKELIKELTRATELFFTDEGMKKFELGESIRYSGQEGYLQNYEEALNSEEGNVKILISLALSNLNKNKCQNAKSYIDKARDINPYNLDLGVLHLKYLICTKKPATNDDEELFQDSKGTVFFKSLEAQKALDEKNYDLAAMFAREAIRLDSQYPTGYYLAWRSLKNEIGEGVDEAQKYLSLCKSISSLMRRKYYMDFNLCLDTESVEEYIKKMEANVQ